MTPLDKERILKQMIQELETRLNLLVDAALEAKEFSTNEESKAENKYDTRGLEASYLASGQAQRAQRLQEQLYILGKLKLTSYSSNDAIGMGAIVEVLVDDSQSRLFFLLPVGGVEVTVSNIKVQSITIESPVGANLLGQKVGYDFEINRKTYEIQGTQ